MQSHLAIFVNSCTLFQKCSFMISSTNAAVAKSGFYHSHLHLKCNSGPIPEEISGNWLSETKFLKIILGSRSHQRVCAVMLSRFSCLRFCEFPLSGLEVETFAEFEARWYPKLGDKMHLYYQYLESCNKTDLVMWGFLAGDVRLMLSVLICSHIFLGDQWQLEYSKSE